MNEATAIAARNDFLDAFTQPRNWRETDTDDLPFPEDTEGLPDDVDPQWCIASYSTSNDEHVSVWLLDTDRAQAYYDRQNDDEWGSVDAVEAVAEHIPHEL